MRYKEIKNFGGREITIRLLSRNDLRHPEKFQKFSNSLVKEDAQIGINKKVTLKEEKERLKRRWNEAKARRMVTLLAEDRKMLVGRVTIGMHIGRQDHVGYLVVMVHREYRRRGIGEYLSRKAIELAKKYLRPSPRIIRLSVLPTNKPAMNLYRKLGFKKVAKIPHQFQYKGKLVDEIVMLLYLDKNLSKKK
ncbi:GNAT family N-acetyltransferase [bacterium]|nr:GNAT family N-acetyltransferase [bacterium]